MDKLRASSDNWIKEVDHRYVEIPLTVRSLPMHEIVKNFKQSIEKNQSDLDKTKLADLAVKIKSLSEGKVEYYKASRFGFIKELFSSLRNLLSLGSFTSSGRLGLELSSKFLKEHPGLSASLEEDPTTQPENQLTETEEFFDASDEEFFDASDSWEEDQVMEGPVENAPLTALETPVAQTETPKEVPPSEQQQIPVESTPVSSTPTPPSSPNEKMLDTVRTIWTHASDQERVYIQTIWNTMMKSADVVKWEATGKPNEYQLELKKEISGPHPELPLPMARIVFKQKMKIAFSEEKIQDSDNYKKIISFPDKGICVRIGPTDWASKDTPLQRILVEEDGDKDVWCSVEAVGKNIRIPAEEILSLWSKWNPKAG